MADGTFVDNLNKIGVELSDKQYEQFDKYYETLVEWNEFMNLTGITEYSEVLLKHFVDSLVLKLPVHQYAGLATFSDDENDNINVIREIKSFFDRNNLTLIDVGTGAGFPGLPIKIAYPEIKVTLLDSLNKRLNFLNEVITRLNLSDINTVHSRAEDGGKNKLLREHFDISVSRAVANLSTLVEYNLPFVKVGGYFVAYKSGDIDEEVYNARNAVKLLGGKIELVYKFRLPGSDIERSLVYVKKEKNCPSKYPRKAGLPSKEPLV
ncbi:MAG: 16S rRNA (guanine(527)-N(7))-methyltransferase RsmG [Lachnospira sp.]